MRTAIAETSIRAYREIEFEGKLGAQEKAILIALHVNWVPGRDWSLQEISKLTGIAINAVAGRVNSLKNDWPRYLEECPQRKCSITGRTVTPITLRRPKVQEELFS